jgi:hypothetical protein
MFLFVEKIISSGGATRAGIFTGYGILGIVCYGVTFVLWHWLEPMFTLLTSATARRPSASPQQHKLDYDIDDDSHRRASQYAVANQPDPGRGRARLTLSPSSASESSSPTTTVGNDKSTSNSDDIYQFGVTLPKSKPLTRPVDQSKLKLSERSIFAQFWSFPCLFGVLFAVVHVNRSNIYLGTIHSQLKFMGDDNATYVTILLAILPCSFLCLPLTSGAVKRYGFIKCMHIVNLLGLAYGIPLLIKYVIIHHNHSRASSCQSSPYIAL